MKNLLFSTFLFFIFTTATGCGVKGRLIPPDTALIPPPESFKGVQVGNSVRLEWSKNAGAKPESISFRIKRVGNDKDSVICVRCEDNWDKIAEISQNDPFCSSVGNLCTFTDSQINTKGKYRYRITAVNREGVEGRFSETADLSIKVPPAKPVVMVENYGGGVRIMLTLHHGENAVKVGYLLYRSSGGEPKRLNREVSFSNEYFDDSPLPGVDYTYFAQTVANKGKEEIFSEPSEKASIRFEFP